MNELETKLKEVKKELKHFNYVSIVAVILMVVGAVLTIVGAICNKKDISAGNPLFYIGIGVMVCVVVLQFAATVVNRKAINEQYRLEKEIRKAKKN